jgi:hypothetical protein
MKNRSRWHFASAAVEEELNADPLQLLADAETVKSNAVRKVFRNGPFYIKLDRRAGKSFCGEFTGAMLCMECGIGVVDHLAWGHSSEGAILVTREAAGFVESSVFFKKRQSRKHCEALARFLAKILASPLYHPDLHLGNVLIHPETAECCLVDVHGVRKRNLFDRLFRMGRMKRCILELRNTCSDSEMTDLITRCGIGCSERFFRKSLAREHLLLEALQPKRRRQIMEGYFKYTRREGNGVLADVDSTGKELQQCEAVSCQDADELFLFHFFLTHFFFSKEVFRISFYGSKRRSDIMGYCSQQIGPHLFFFNLSFYLFLLLDLTHQSTDKRCHRKHNNGCQRISRIRKIHSKIRVCKNEVDTDYCNECSNNSIHIPVCKT